MRPRTLIWLLMLSLLTITMAVPALAQDRAGYGPLPDAFALTKQISGTDDNQDEKISDALDEIAALAKKRNLKLSEKRIVIRENMGLKTFKSRVGYLLAGSGKPGVMGNGIELRKLARVRAWVSTGNDQITSHRRLVLDEVEKKGVRRLKGVELIEIFEGDPEDKATTFHVYAPLAR